MSEFVISELHTYPIKSCAPAAGVAEYNVTDYGLQYDREWMVARPNGSFLSQRVFPELAVVRTEITEAGLRVTAPGNGSIVVPLERDIDEAVNAVPIEIFKKRGSGVFETQEAHDFFSDYLGKDVRLVRSVEPRPINPDYRRPWSANASRFADGFPFLLTTTASLEFLRDISGSDLAMSRFRPNIVVGDGNLRAEQFEEDHWLSMRIGKLQAQVVRACARCPVPDVDQTTGKRSTERPVDKVLKQARAGVEAHNGKSGIFFGQNLIHTLAENIKLRVGDSVDIISRSHHPNVDID